MSSVTAFSQEMWIAAAILLGAYVLIFTEVLHRTSAGVVGAVVMVGLGNLFGFYSQARCRNGDRCQHTVFITGDDDAGSHAETHRWF